MYRLQGVPYYDFSAKNKYATNYNLAYKRAVQAQSELLDLKNSPNSTVAEIDKWKKDLERWKKNVESYSIMAKQEEARLDNQQKASGQILNIMG